MITASSFRCSFAVIVTQFILILYLQYTLNVTLKKPSKTVINTRIEEKEPIDVVFTWVNGSEPRFLEQLHRFSKRMKIKTDVNEDRRFAEKNELKYSLRSIEKNMPWIRHVFIVTNRQVPNWLNVHNGLATVVPHEDIFPNKSVLPTFASPAIEANIHRIPGLSKKFLYFNDDLLIGSPVELSTFYTQADGVHVFWEYAVPKCSYECPWSIVNNGHCDAHCYNPECQMDGNDCATPPARPKIKGSLPRMYLDKFFLSIQETNRHFNKLFGFEVRYVYPHMPIMVDRDVMTEGWLQFPAEFTNTTSHRFRDEYTMQFQFFNTYFMHGKQVRIPLAEALQLEDVNLDGHLDSSEFRTILAKHYQGTPSEKQNVEFSNVLQTCLINVTDIYLPNFEVNIDITLLSNCQALTKHFGNTLMQKPKYKHVLEPSTIGDYFYVHRRLISNLTNVVELLNDLRVHPRKFICLNDELTHNPKMRKVNAQVYEELANFYQSMFPVPSRYELPPGEVNQFDYIQNVTLRNVPTVEKQLEQSHVQTDCNGCEPSGFNTFIIVSLSFAAFAYLMFLFYKLTKLFYINAKPLIDE